MFPPTWAVLIHPKPPVVWPAALRVWVAKAFVLLGTFKPVRLKMFVNSARICKLARSLIRIVRPRLMLSTGCLCCR